MFYVGIDPMKTNRNNTASYVNATDHKYSQRNINRAQCLLEF